MLEQTTVLSHSAVVSATAPATIRSASCSFRSRSALKSPMKMLASHHQWPRTLLVADRAPDCHGSGLGRGRASAPTMTGTRRAGCVGGTASIIWRPHADSARMRWPTRRHQAAMACVPMGKHSWRAHECRRS